MNPEPVDQAAVTPSAARREQLLRRVDRSLAAASLVSQQAKSDFELHGPLASQPYWKVAAMSLVAAIACTVWSSQTHAAVHQQPQAAKAQHKAAYRAGSVMGAQGQARMIEHLREFSGGHRMGLPQITVRTLNGDFSTLNPLERVRLCRQIARQEGLDKVGLDWRHIYGVIHAESNWAPQDGKSRDGQPNRGISQLEDDTARALGVTDAYDERQAVAATAKLLKESRKWSASRGIPASSATMALSVHYNLSTAARNAWDGLTTTSLPLETQRHIANVAKGIQYADFLGKQYERWHKAMGQSSNAATLIRSADRLGEEPTGEQLASDGALFAGLDAQAAARQRGSAALRDVPNAAQRLLSDHGPGPVDLPDPHAPKLPALVADRGRDGTQRDLAHLNNAANDDEWQDTVVMDRPAAAESWAGTRSGPVVVFRRMGSAMARLMAGAVREQTQRLAGLVAAPVSREAEPDTQGEHEQDSRSVEGASYPRMRV